jgi:hypothetical protein
MRTYFEEYHCYQRIDRLSLRSIRNELKRKRLMETRSEKNKQIVENIQKRNPLFPKRYYRHMEEILNMPTVKPLPFVYHISRSENRTAIIQDGLIKGNGFKECPAVFANNSIIDNYRSFYPLYLDQGVRFDYDIWRIETENLGVKWHIDPANEFEGRDDDFFICTFSDIPAKALTLFRIVPTKFCVDGIHIYNELVEFRIKEHKLTSRLIDWNHEILPVLNRKSLNQKLY